MTHLSLASTWDFMAWFLTYYTPHFIFLIFISSFFLLKAIYLYPISLLYVHLFMLKSSFGKKWQTPWPFLWYPILSDIIPEAPSSPHICSGCVQNDSHFSPSFRSAVIFIFNPIHLLSSVKDLSWFLIPKSIPCCFWFEFILLSSLFCYC